MRKGACVVGVLALGFLALVLPDARSQTAGGLTIDASREVGAINRNLGGLGLHAGGAPLTSVAELHPHLVRIDASLESVSPSAGVLQLDALLSRVASARAIGAEPLVILSYMPAWLGGPTAFGRDATKVPPADPGAWENLVHDVVLRLATAPAPARRFEAWNEPDVPIFWQDTPLAFADTMVLSARAVARVEQETGLDLVFGGPATAVPDPIYVSAFLSAFRTDPTLPLDFVSWHYYGNLPFFGPDGTEFGETSAFQPIIGQRNPLTSPSAFGPQVALMRQTAGLALAGSGRPGPSMLLDEWNLSSGGFDLRHDTNVGAAFDAGVLAELQDAGLEESAFFRANDTRTTGGDHGLVRVDGAAKPAWWTFWLWRQLAARQVRVDGASEGLWAVASKDADRVTILLASFSASSPVERLLDVDVAGLDWTPAAATVRRIDASHGSASLASPLEVSDGRVHVDLAPQSVAFVELRRVAADASPSVAARAAAGGLPPTGGAGAGLGIFVAALGILAVRARKAVTPPR